MERWAPAPAREERPRRRAGQPSFSSSLLDAICDSLDDQSGGAGTTARSAGSGGDKKQQEAAALHCYYYKPSLAASHRAAPPPADDCSVRGYFSSSEVEHSIRRLRPIRTSAAGGGAGAASVAPAEKHNHHQPPATKGKARKPSSAAVARGGCRRPASPGARLAGLINAIFSGKRHSARQHPAPADDEPPPCSTTAPSTARPCLARTPPPSARAARPRPRRSRSSNRTVRFLDIDGEVAVAAAASGCRRVPVVEVEEDTDAAGGEESSDASSDLFELENLAAIAPGSGGVHCRRACGDELPVYGTTGAGLRHDIGHRRRPFGYGSHGRSRTCSRVV
ncbi:unnamed protein product [Urochloa decumbens]|uniref:Uncharacterized protein n=1 Tax=Urochloa decumbens TaxID=240449 RepID=A0ABC9H4X2_9POAL